jgi:hypothetical protein
MNEDPPDDANEKNCTSKIGENGCPESKNYIAKEECSPGKSGDDTDDSYLQDMDNIPTNIRSLYSGYDVPADRNNKKDFVPPEWLDMKKFMLGQNFAIKHTASLCFAELLSLFMIFNFKGGLDALIYTNKSNTPFTAFKRYTSTFNRVYSWYTTNIWDASTTGARNISTVRAMHRNLRDHINNETKVELNEKIHIKNPCSPLTNFIIDDARKSVSEIKSSKCPYNFFPHRYYMSQLDMFGTQFAFIGLVVLYPEKFGIYATEKELDAFLHVWAGIGYLLGIEDEYNLCLGGLNQCKERVAFFIEEWVKPNFRDVEPEWEHMSRSVVEGVKHSSPAPNLCNFESHFLYLCWVINFPLNSFVKVIPTSSRIIFAISKFTFCKLMTCIPGFRNFMNWSVIRQSNRVLKSPPNILESIKKQSDEYMKKYSTSNILIVENQLV